MDHRRVLVTGGAGFIGSELVRQLVERRDNVIVVDTLINGRRENLAGLPEARCQLSLTDIRDERSMRGLVEDVDTIFHLACLGVRHSIHSPLENHEVNATATLKLLRLAREAGVRCFVHCSSSEVYGTALWVPMTEEHPTRPATVYGSSKLAGECYARAYYRTYGLPTVVVRPFNAYGPRCHHEGDSGEVIPKSLLRCMAGRAMVVFGDGNQTRDFTFVGDTVAGILLAAEREEAIGQTINLGSGKEISINDLAERVAECLGCSDFRLSHVLPRPGDVLRHCADITKAQKLLGFQPAVSLHEGLTRLRDWYLSVGTPPDQLLRDDIERNWEIESCERNNARS